MFEARSGSSAVFKKIIEAMKDLVTEGNLDCSGNGIAMQAMDSSHVSLIAMMLREEGFDHYRCDRNISLGINLATLSKILKCFPDGCRGRRNFRSSDEETQAILKMQK